MASGPIRLFGKKINELDLGIDRNIANHVFFLLIRPPSSFATNFFSLSIYKFDFVLIAFREK